jgi:hypothetical protein
VTFVRAEVKAGGRGRGRAPAAVLWGLCVALALAAPPAAGTASAAPHGSSRDSSHARRSAPRRPERFEFAGIPWLAPADSARKALEARGWGPVRVHETTGWGHLRPELEIGRRGGAVPNMMVLEGHLFDHWCSLHATLDDRRRVLRWEIVIPPGREEAPYPPMRGLFDDIVAELNGKYGTRSTITEAYEFPHARGDGHEARALELGMAKIRSEWTSRRADRISLDLLPDLTVLLTYASRDWTEMGRLRRTRNARDL